MLTMEHFQEVTVGRKWVEVDGVALQICLFAVDGLLIDTSAKSIANDVLHFASRVHPHQIVLTHLHEDHSGMAGQLQERFQVPVYVHPDFVEAAGKPFQVPMYRQRFWGLPDPFMASPVGEWIETERYCFEVIHTPGHAEDHIVLYEPNRGWLFSGDLFLAPKVKIVMKQESMPLLMDSLRRVLELDFETLFCAHAGVVPNGQALLRQKLEHLAWIEEQVDRLAAEGKNLRQITRQLFPKRAPIYYLSRGEWSSTHIVRSFLQNSIQTQMDRDTDSERMNGRFSE